MLEVNPRLACAIPYSIDYVTVAADHAFDISHFYNDDSSESEATESDDEESVEEKENVKNPTHMTSKVSRTDTEQRIAEGPGDESRLNTMTEVWVRWMGFSFNYDVIVPTDTSHP